MGRRNYLIEGLSGVGKTSVAEELARRGHHVVHGDRELAYAGDPVTGEPVPDGGIDGRPHEHHLWRVDRVRALAADPEHAETFFCGGSRNVGDFLDLFDAVVVLTVDLPTLLRRLAARTGDEWGVTQAQRDLVERLHRSGESTPDGIVVDATLPLSRVVDEVLRVTSSA